MLNLTFLRPYRAKKLLFALLFIYSFSQTVTAQCDFMMQGWYWDYPINWVTTLQTKAADIGASGFKYVWLPPLSKGSSGINSSGYDPKDLYDLGDYGQTRFGTRAQVNSVIAALNAAGVKSVADMVYNHRDGGAPEVNPAVKNYITTYYNASKSPYPSDRFRCILPIGGATGNGAGDYYIKVSSKTNDAQFNGKPYTFYAQTNATGWQALPDGSEGENQPGGNGGGDCGQNSCIATLGRNFIANVETGGGCGTDEYKITLTAANFNPAGDTMFIFLSNSGGNYSDHRIYGLWSASRSADIVNEIKYQTYTNFSASVMPSGMGNMNFENFKPNTANAATQTLSGDWDGMYFFYDYDQFSTATETELNNWTKWMWTNVGVRGLRMDAVKHFTPQYVRRMLENMNAAGYNPGMVVGEWFDSNASILKGWVDNVYAGMNSATSSAVKVRIFDFALREALKNTCDNGSDARNIFNSGVVDAAGGSGFNSVTFINNHDFRDAFQPVYNDVPQAYAYILSNNKVGVPTVFYSDYYGIRPNVNYPPAVVLKPQIDQLIQAHNLYICGSTGTDYLNKLGTSYSSNFISGSSDRSLVFQLTGNAAGRSVVVAINFSGNTLKVDHAINTSGTFGSATTGTRFTDILGRSNFPFALVNGNNQIYMEVPPHSYSIWVQGTQTPLPTEIIDFQVNSSKKSVRINWTTANETNMSGFDLERSANGKDFEKITNLTSKGKEGTGSSYDFEDNNVWFGSEIYYRLKSIDKDGTFKYSPIRSARLEQSIATFELAPNPVVDFVAVSFTTTQAAEAKISVVNAIGETVISPQIISANKGTNTTQLDLQKLAAGIYFVNFEINQQQISERIVKK